jgi:predicted nucleic acid-binding protein
MTLPEYVLAGFEDTLSNSNFFNNFASSYDELSGFMDHKPNIYLDTSVPNFLFAEDSPEKKEVTVDFFENFIQKGKYKAFISSLVITEIENTQDPLKRLQLLDSLSKYPIEIISLDNFDEVEKLAQKYIDSGAIPVRKIMDALHVAVCTVYGINILVSWNFKHLANINHEYKIRSVNYQNNYFNELRIITPMEMIDYGNEDI